MIILINRIQEVQLVAQQLFIWNWKHTVTTLLAHKVEILLVIKSLMAML